MLVKSLKILMNIPTHPWKPLLAYPVLHEQVLGIEWNATSDHFRLTVARLLPLNNVTKRFLVSDIAKTYDVLGWFAPCVIKAKILLQQLWEMKIDWDDDVPMEDHAVGILVVSRTSISPTTCLN